MSEEDRPRHHSYDVLDYQDYIGLQALFRSYSSKEKYPAYNLVTKAICKDGIPIKTWDGEHFVNNMLQMDALSTYGAYNLVFGNRKYDHSFIYLGECHHYITDKEKAAAQQERDSLEADMMAHGKEVQHRVIGAKSALHGYPGHQSLIMRGCAEELANAGWYGTNKRQSIYVTPSAWKCPLHYDKRGKQRQRENLASYQSIVIDLDCELLHDKSWLATNRHFMDELRRLTSTLMVMLFSAEYGALPLPTIIHDSGRGVQIWYTFDSISVQAQPLYDKLVAAFAAAFTAVFDEYGDMLSLDCWDSAKEDVSRRLAYTFDKATLTRQATGWMRAFNSYNGSIGRRTQAYVPYVWGTLDGQRCKLVPSPIVRPTANELLFQLCEIVPDIAADLLPPKVLLERCPVCGRPLVLRTGPYGQFVGCSGYKAGCTYHRPTEENTWKECTDAEIVKRAPVSPIVNCMRHRMAAVRWLIGRRQGTGQSEGWRDIYLFHYYNSAVMAMPREKAWAETQSLNNRLTVPLDEGDMANIKYAVDNVKDGHYKYKESTWLSDLGVTEEEAKHIATMSGSRESEKAMRQERKDIRNAQIESLREAGASQEEIARTVGASSRTVRRHLKQTGVSKKEARDSRIREMNDAGRTKREIADALGVSISTVKRALRGTNKPKA